MNPDKIELLLKQARTYLYYLGDEKDVREILREENPELEEGDLDLILCGGYLLGEG
jgi:hypothetical protein